MQHINTPAGSWLKNTAGRPTRNDLAGRGRLETVRLFEPSTGLSRDFCEAMSSLFVLLFIFLGMPLMAIALCLASVAVASLPVTVPLYLAGGMLESQVASEDVAMPGVMQAEPGDAITQDHSRDAATENGAAIIGSWLESETSESPGADREEAARWIIAGHKNSVLRYKKKLANLKPASDSAEGKYVKLASICGNYHVLAKVIAKPTPGSVEIVTKDGRHITVNTPKLSMESISKINDLIEQIEESRKITQERNRLQFLIDQELAAIERQSRLID